jgi:hypothetical protein
MGAGDAARKIQVDGITKVADLVVREAMKPTTAMRHIMKSRPDWGATDATLLRRWQGKWRANQDAFLTAAREQSRPMSIQETIVAIW